MNRTPEEALGNLGSPIPNQYQSDLDQFEFSNIRENLELELEHIVSSTTSLSPSLVPYNEDTTQVNFPPLDQTRSSSSLLLTYP